jgi:nickel-dependent lactate racemase
MATKTINFGFGDKSIPVTLPAEKIMYEIEGKPAQGITNIPEAVKEALRNPIGSPPLKEVVCPGDTVVIIVSDITRGWIQSNVFLPILLNELNAAGIPDKDISIVIALGTHRPHTEQENVVVCGEEVCHRVAFYAHDCLDQSQLTYLGTTKRGTPAYINKHVAAADKVILTGGIVFHLMGGFGGGRKSVMPGVSGDVTIQTNHSLGLHAQVGHGANPECMSGKLVGNPVHEDMADVAELLNPAFLLNAVYTPEGEFAQFFAGHWYKAWEAGCKKVAEIYGIPIEKQADLVIASAGGFPKDINLYQGSKTIDNAFLAVKPGGVIIAFMECRDIAEPAEFSDWFRYKDLLEFEKAVRAHFTIPGFIAFKLADIAQKNTLIVVTKPENAEFIRNTGMIPAFSAEEALTIAKAKLRRENYTITCMTHGANTAPLLK